jgi:aminoglycoside phosphotransferase (APT) family kinase protein
MDAPAELQEQLTTFCRAQTGDPLAEVTDVATTPGHAGFSYYFRVRHGRNGAARDEQYVLRLPPPNVKLEGTADVLRQAKVLNALRDTAVPVAPVIWSGDDPRWFGRPYFVVPRLRGDTLMRLLEREDAARFDAATLRHMARQAMAALAALHKVDWRQAVPEWGPPVDPEPDVVRWDRFWERAADPELVKLGPEVRRRLLERLPATPRMGIFHGDFQSSNLFYDGDRLVAVIDWELVGCGPVLNDLGWIMLFHDNDAWAHPRNPAPLPEADELGAMYIEAFGEDPGDVAWYRALAGYKFAIISGFNLMLHRRGKRHDPHWETMVPSIPRLFERALEVLDRP